MDYNSLYKIAIHNSILIKEVQIKLGVRENYNLLKNAN
jgi:hypothetical protein